MFMAAVKSSSDVPSYPLRQKTFSARSSASSASNARGRPRPIALPPAINCLRDLVFILTGTLFHLTHARPAAYLVPLGTESYAKETTMANGLKEKVALVTGGSRGIGAAI